MARGSLVGAIICFMKIMFSKDKIHIDENIKITNQSTLAPTIRLKNTPWKTEILPQVKTTLIQDSSSPFRKPVTDD